LPHQGNEEIDLPIGLVERPAVFQQAVEQLRGPAAGLRHVDMRVGAVADHCGRVPHHLRRHVRVVVEARDDRHPVADERPDAPQQLALAVLVMFGDHCAVQIEIDAVERTGRGEVFEHRPGHRLVGVALDIGGRRRRAPAERHKVVSQFLQCLDGAGDRDVEPLDRIDQLGPADKARPRIRALEIRPGRTLRRKSVGFVLKPADRNPRHVLIPTAVPRLLRYSFAGPPASRRFGDYSSNQ
jgi:hypothetical protein